MNKKLLIITMCVLVLTFFVCTAFAPQTAQADVSPLSASGQKIVVTGVQNVGDFALLLSDYDGQYVHRQSSLTANNLGGGVWEFVLPSDIRATDLYVTLLVSSGQFDGRIFYVNRVLYSYGNNAIRDLDEGFSSYQATIAFYEDEMPAWDTLYIDYAVTWEQRYFTALQTEIEEVTARLNEALATLESYETWGKTGGVIQLLFEKVGNVLEIQLLPGVTIGLIVAIPLILGVVFLVLRLVRGE